MRICREEMRGRTGRRYVVIGSVIEGSLYTRWEVFYRDAKVGGILTKPDPRTCDDLYGMQSHARQ